MTSRTFNLGDGSEPKTGTSWAKILIALCCLLVVIVVIIVSCYAYKTNFGGHSSCGIPVLDENGLSNWTTGADAVAFVCFPGYFLEGHDTVLVSECVNGTWTPAAPACNYLPLRLDCEVNFQGISGNISMWQKDVASPAFIYGLVDYEDVDRSVGHLKSIVPMSKSNCIISNDVTNVIELYPDPSTHTLKIEFNSTQLKAYNKAEIHINLIFVDNNTTASLVSVHQEDRTFVLPNSMPFSRVPRDFFAQYGFQNI